MFIKIFKNYYYIFGICVTIEKSFAESLDNNNIGYDNRTSKISISENALEVAGKNRANTHQDSAIEDFYNSNGTFLRRNDNLSSNKDSLIGMTTTDNDYNYRPMFFEHNNNLDVQGTKKSFPSGTIINGEEKTLKDIVNYQNKPGVIGDEIMNSMLKNNKKIKLVVNMMNSTHQSIDTTWKKYPVDPSTVSSRMVTGSAHGQRKGVIHSMINSSVPNNHFQAGEIAVRIMDDDDFDCFNGMMVCKKWKILPDNIRPKIALKINDIIEEAMAGKIKYDRVDDGGAGGGSNDNDNNDCNKSKRRVKREKHCCKRRKSAKCKGSVDKKKTISGRRFANLNIGVKKMFTMSKSVFTTPDITTTISSTTSFMSTTIKMVTQSIATTTKKKIYSKRKKCSRKLYKKIV